MKQALLKHNLLAKGDEKNNPGKVIQGWAIAYLKNTTVLYHPFTGKNPTIETEAMIFETEYEALNQSKLNDLPTMIVAVRGDKETIEFGGMPTKKGKI